MNGSIWKSNKCNDNTNIPIKKSFGVILCKINYITNNPEVLLVHKRYTYAYTTFVYGKYSKPNIWPKFNNGYILNILSQMTVNELLDIWSLNFEQMWYRISLQNINDELYKKKYNKFYNTFIKFDNGIN